jgi:hypothetical protein
MKKKRLPTGAENMLRMRRVLSFPNYAVVEFKFFGCQHLGLVGISIGDFINVAKQCGFGKFIILNRRNYLKRIVSSQVGLARGGKWHAKMNEEVAPVTIHLDVENVNLGYRKATPLVELFEYMDEQYQRLRTALAREDVIELTYEEDIFHDPMVAFNKICQWLNVESISLQINYRRTSVNELNEVVENWREVSEVLLSTQYAWMVE